MRVCPKTQPGPNETLVRSETALIAVVALALAAKVIDLLRIHAQETGHLL